MGKIDIFMKINLQLCAFVLGSLSILSCQSQVPQKLDGKNLVWHDEFDKGSTPDLTKWKYDTGGHGFGNNELQYYTTSPKNARIEEGNLILQAHKENYQSNHYTSAKLQTKGLHSWKYATVEVRAKLPKGRGTWPAIWMMSENMKDWPRDGEIDIMEHVGYNHGFVHASIHTEKYNHIINTQITDTIEVPTVSEQFHVYKMDWNKQGITMYVDGEKYYHVEKKKGGYDAWPFDQPFYLILNQAVGGNWGGKEGVDSTIYPQSFLIDYVRVYQ